MRSDPESILPPPAAFLALEGRVWLELAALLPALPFLGRAPVGDGHPVMVLPGWLASDRSTRPLRWFLRDRGYHAHGWRLGLNRGPTTEIAAALEHRFLSLRERHGERLSLIGWSLGGIYARELARKLPEHVRQVITLGSPFRNPGATTVARLYRSRLGPRRPASGVDAERAMWQRIRAPIPVPSTSIYSRTDGIVAWRSCLHDDGPQSENIEVWSSHVGMGHHPTVMLTIADRLAQRDGAWRPFRPGSWNLWPFGTGVRVGADPH
jgi:pimeloyl-ACP methyl ester carboxylesterase